MKVFRHYLLTFIASLVLLLTLMQVATWQTVTIQSSEVAINGNEFKAATLPWKNNHTGEYQTRTTLSPSIRSELKIRIFPDDEILSLSLNGREISLAKLSIDQRRDYHSGFDIVLTELSSSAPNVLEARLKNESNPAGYNIKIGNNLSFIKSMAILTILMLLALVISRHLPISKLQWSILFLALVLSLLYLSKTDDRTRTFDVYEGGGHKDYVEYLIEHKALPMPGDGWEYHQPPLYYLTAALAKQTNSDITSSHGEHWAQLLALYLWTLFLVSSLATIRLVTRKSTLLLAFMSLALCLWPAGIIHSIRMGNDAGVYACYGLAFFFTVKWWYRRRSLTLFWASLWMAGALLCKSNGLAVASTLGVLMLLHIYNVVKNRSFFEKNKSKLWRDMAIAGGFFIAAITLNFADNVKHYLDGTSEDWLLSNVSEMINPGLRVENNLKNYLILDAATFIEEPFISTWEDKYGRQYFWNFVLRSSLTAEFFFEGKAMAAWGITNGILLLVGLVGSFIFFIQKQPQVRQRQLILTSYRHAPWILALIFPFILLLAYRIKVPLSCNTDFRYIYPVILPLLFFALLTWRSQPALRLSRALTLALPLIGLNSFYWIGVLITQ